DDTMAEKEANRRESAILDARADPEVAAILARFPGARIIDVRIPDAVAEDDPMVDPAPDADEDDS
ncbi:MAG: DNA polymerase III subunit gamma/tau, partial [Nitratireductor sp.]